jgi:hypothetical protein
LWYGQQVFPILFCLLKCWLEVDMHLKGPEIGHLDTDYVGLPLSFGKYWDGFQVPIWHCVLQIQNPLFKFIKTKPPSCKDHHIIFLHITKFDNNWENQNKRQSPSTSFLTHTLMTLLFNRPMFCLKDITNLYCYRNEFTVSWNIETCSLGDKHRRFGGMCCLHLRK